MITNLDVRLGPAVRAPLRSGRALGYVTYTPWCSPGRGSDLEGALASAADGPGRDQAGRLRPRAVRFLQVVVGLDELKGFVRRGDGVIQDAGVTRVNAYVDRDVHNQSQDGDAGQMRRGGALRCAQAPH